MSTLSHAFVFAVMREITGDDRYETALERTRKSVPFSLVVKDALSRPFLMLVYEPIVLFFSLYLTMV